MEGVREEKRGEERWRAVGQKQGLTYLTTGCSAPQRLLAPLLLIVRGINRMRPAAEPSRRVDEKKVQSSRISNTTSCSPRPPRSSPYPSAHFPVDFYYLFLLQSCLGESRSLEPKSYVTVPSFLADLRFRSSEMTRFNLRIFRGELSARSVSGE